LPQAVRRREADPGGADGDSARRGADRPRPVAAVARGGGRRWPMTEPLRAVLYCRVSSDSPGDVKRQRQGDDPSIAEQLRACRASAAARGMTVVAEFVDEGRPASDRESDRPQFRQMLERLERRGDYEAVVVLTLDRWSRLEPFDFVACSDPFR